MLHQHYQFLKSRYEQSHAILFPNGKQIDAPNISQICVKFRAALQAEAELGEYCRARGLFLEQVRSWRAVCELAFDPAAVRSKANSAKADRQRIRVLGKDLGRKDRALAETAALLILRKKAAAIWGRKRTNDQHPRSPRRGNAD